MLSVGDLPRGPGIYTSLTHAKRSPGGRIPDHQAGVRSPLGRLEGGRQAVLDVGPGTMEASFGPR